MLQSAAMLSALTAAPALFLFLGAWPRFLRFLPSPIRAAAPALAALLSGVSAIWMGLVVARSGAPLEFVIAPWAGEAFVDAPALRVDVLTALCLALIALCAFLAQLRAVGEMPGPGEEAGLAEPPFDPDSAPTTLVALWPGRPRSSMLVPAAAALFTAGTHAPLGLALSWVLLDLALAGPGRGGRRTLLGGQLGLFLALAGLTGAGRAYLVAAGAVRAGLYPVSWSLPRSDDARPWRALGLRVPVTIAGLHLAFVAGERLSLGAGLDRPTLIAGMLAVFFGALLAHLAKKGARGQDWATSSHAGLVLLALGLNDPFGRAIAVALLLAFVLLSCVRYVAAGLGERAPARAGRGIAWAALVGLPPTLGFAARWMLYDVLLVRGQRASLAALAVAAAAAVLLAVPPRARWLPSPPARRFVVPFTWVVLAVAGLELALGLAFPLVSALAQATGASGLPHPLAILGSSLAVLADPEARGGAMGTVGDAALRLVLIGSAPLLGWLLRRFASTAKVSPPAADSALRTVLGLDAVFELGLRWTLRFGELAQVRSGLVEGRRAMATSLLGAIALGAALFGPRAETSAAAWPALPTWPLLVGALATVVAMHLPRARLWTLLALVAGHALAGLHLALAGAPLFVGLVQLLVGLLAAGMLAISVMQAPIDRRLVAAARRLRDLRARGALGPDFERTRGSERLVLLLSLAVMAGIALGLPAAAGASRLVGAALVPAFVLLAGGLLTVLHARSALHLSCGVLLSLTGFVAIYGLLDAGLLITGVLAVVQLLFAVVASAFVGSSPTVVHSVRGGPAGGETPDPAAAEPDDLRPEIL